MNVGIGIMAMPTAFYNSGTVMGLVGMSVMAIITIHCMHLLVSPLYICIAFVLLTQKFKARSTSTLMISSFFYVGQCWTKLL